MKMIILSSFFLLNVLVTLLGIANGAGTSPVKQKHASGKQPMEVDGAVQEKQKETECGICLEEIETNEKQPQELPCGHVFHQNCIQPWLTKHNTCPTCRYQIPINKEINDGNIVKPITYRDLNIHDLERGDGRIAINGYPISDEAWRSVNNYWQMTNESIRNETIANARRIRDEGLTNARRVLNEALATARRDEALATARRDEALATAPGDEALADERRDEALATARGDVALVTARRDEALATARRDEALATARRDEALQLRDEMNHRQWRDKMNHRQWRDKMNHRQLRNEMKHRQLRDEMKHRQLRNMSEMKSYNRSIN